MITTYDIRDFATKLDRFRKFYQDDAGEDTHTPAEETLLCDAIDALAEYCKTQGLRV